MKIETNRERRTRRAMEARSRIVRVLTRGGWWTASQIVHETNSTWDSPRSVAGHLEHLHAEGVLDRRHMENAPGGAKVYEYTVRDD
jgi:predicted ArsR family transcriptional regulator